MREPGRCMEAGEAGCGHLNVPPSPGTATLQRLPDAKHSGGRRGRRGPKLGAWALDYRQGRRPPHAWDLFPPRSPAQRTPGVRHPPRGPRGATASVRRGWRGARPGPPLGTAAPSEQQRFLLQVVPLPEGQAVELFHAHSEHLLELLRGQVSLQTTRKSQSGAVSNFAAHP